MYLVLRILKDIIIISISINMNVPSLLRTGACGVVHGMGVGVELYSSASDFLCLCGFRFFVLTSENEFKIVTRYGF